MSAVADGTSVSFQSRLNLIRSDPMGAIGGVAFVLIALTVIFAPWVAMQDPLATDIDAKLQPPSSTHLFGTDEAGRDVFARVVWGGRYSLGIAVGIVAISGVAGTLVGGAAGLLGGRFDATVMRATDMAMSFPYFIPALIVAMMLGASARSTIVALAAVWWPSYVRIVRGRVLEIRNEAYVEAARALGATDKRILMRHVLPQCSEPIRVKITNDLGGALIAATSLSFVGLGVRPPEPEWGSLIAVARLYVFQAWWYAVAPGAVVTVTVLAMIIGGDWVIALRNPYRQRRVIPHS
jgi:peptide/nickel transport system permease protein